MENRLALPQTARYHAGKNKSSLDSLRNTTIIEEVGFNNPPKEDELVRNIRRKTPTKMLEDEWEWLPPKIKTMIQTDRDNEETSTPTIKESDNYVSISLRDGDNCAERKNNNS